MRALVHRKGNLGIELSKDFGQMLGTPGIKANDGAVGGQETLLNSEVDASWIRYGRRCRGAMTVVRGWGATICFAEQMSAASGVRFVQGLTGRWRPCEASSSRSARRIARSEIQVVKVERRA